MTKSQRTKQSLSNNKIQRQSSIKPNQQTSHLHQLNKQEIKQ